MTGMRGLDGLGGIGAGGFENTAVQFLADGFHGFRSETGIGTEKALEMKLIDFFAGQFVGVWSNGLGIHHE